jgi:endonuclease-3 related protein
MGEAMGQVMGQLTRKATGKAAEKYAPPGASGGSGRVSQGVAGTAEAFPPSGELLRYYEVMAGALGPMHWWPARTPFEVIVGAILTQSTAWGNVERAIANLRAARLLTPSAILRVRTARLATLVRPSGYFRQKAKKLKSFVRFLQQGYGGSLKRMFLTPTSELREKLLSVHGIGPETADSILLYAGNHPVFVVDAYTHRIFGRHGITDGRADYEKVRALVETSIPRRPDLFNELHALIVNTGKNWCRKSAPRCEECPLRPLLPSNSPLSTLAAILQSGTPLSGSVA